VGNDIHFQTTGTYYLKASDGTRNVCSSSSFTVTPGTLASLVITPSVTTTTLTGSSVITVTGKDAYANTVTNNNSSVLVVNLDGDTQSSNLAPQFASGSTYFTITKPTAGTGSFTVVSQGTLIATGAVLFTDGTTPVDSTAPSFVSSTPSNASTALATTAGTAQAQYSEALTLVNAASITLKNATTLATVASGSATVSSSTVAIDYTTLDYGTTYVLTIGSGALSDATGNLVTGTTSIYFTTQSAAAPDITTLAIGSITASQAVLTYTTDVVPTTSQYRIATSAYSGTWTTLTASPMTLTGLAANTSYYYQVRFTKDGQTVNSVPLSFKTASAATGIAITSISRIPHGDPVVGADYGSGYHFRFHVTAYDTSETNVAFKLADWSNGSTTLAALNNTKMVLSQNGVADYATGSGNAIAVTTTYGSTGSVAGYDADPSTGGRQFVIDVFYKIPTGAAGIYSTSYGISTTP
jgi:hypothetical protein